jgi:FKBP-type peptidyl-prolyl cis-trans isomerase FkpA
MLRLVAAIFILTAATAMAAGKGNDGPTKVTGPGTKLPDGLQYWDIKEGTGDTAKPHQTVTVHYTGWLTNGTKFDSSVDRGQPISFSLDQVIKGWGEGVPGMKIGGKRQLKIPSPLAYGTEGHPPVIPGNATLIFDIELLGVK